MTNKKYYVVLAVIMMYLSLLSCSDLKIGVGLKGVILDENKITLDGDTFDIRERIINSLSGNDKNVAMMAYHWELLNFLNRELYNGDNDSVNLVMSKYNKIYEKEYYNWVSIKQKIKNVLMINSGKNYKSFSFNKVILAILK